MSETVKVGRNRPSQNGWASKEEVAELRAEVAELRETNQAMLEEIKGLRAELGGAKRHRLLGAVATSAAAFFGKFFHRGKDLGDFHEEKSSKGANRGAHAKGKEKEKGGTPIVSARRGEKSKNSREQEDKPNKNKTSGIGKKIVAGALALALVAGSAVAAFGPHKNAQDLPKDPSITETNANLHMPETEQALAEQAVEAAEAAHQQQLAETMGMSVEDMHAVADRHGVNHNDIGTAKAHDQMRDNMESDYNLSEKIDLDNMSEAERSERSKQEILFANMNNKYVTAEISSARLGAHDASDSELTRQLFERYEGSDAVWQKDAEGNAKFLKEATFSTYLADTTMANTYGTERQWDGPIEEQRTTKNSGGETVYMVEVANGDIKIQFKDGCVQAAWVEEAAQPRQQVERRTVVQQEVVQQKERHQEKQSQQYSWERKGGEIERRQNDSKDPKANDTQQNADKNFEDDSKANDDAPTYGGQKNPDTSAKSGNTDNNPDNGSEVVPDDKNGSIGGKQDAKPGQQDWGDGGGAADSGQDKTAANPGDQGGSGKNTTGDSQTDSGSGSKETGRRSSSQHRSSEWKKGGRVTIDENGNITENSYSSASDTGWVNDNNDDTHSGGNQANGDVELQNIVVSGT